MGTEHVGCPALIGVANEAGYLADSMPDLINRGLEPEFIPQVAVQEFVELRRQEPHRIALLDVREPGEWSAGVIEGSVRIPLGELQSRTDELDRERLLVVYCRSGHRSSIATSLLRHAGFRDIANLAGGFDAWQTAGLPYIFPGREGITA